MIIKYLMKQAHPLKVREYVDKQGDSPFRNWLDSLDLAIKARVQARILRVESGNLGDHKSVGAGVTELRLDLDPVIAFISEETAILWFFC